MRLYFFPALAPLAAVMPALMAAVGVVSAGVHCVLKRRAPRRYRVPVLTVLCLSLIALGGLQIQKWRRYAVAAPALNSVESLPALLPSGSWTQALPRPALSNLAYSARYHLVILGTERATVDAFSAKDGTLKFSLQMAEPVLAPPTVIAAQDGQHLIVGEGLHDANSARLVSLKLPEGEVLWHRRFGGHIESAPRVSRDGKTLYGCAGQAGAYAVEADSGRLIWGRSVGHCDTTPSLFQSETVLLLLAETAPGHSALKALQTKDGELLWQVELPGSPWGTPVYDSRTKMILVTTGTGQLGPKFTPDEAGWSHAVDPEQGRLVWTRKLGGLPLLRSELLSHEGLVLHTLKQGEIIALRAKNGTPVWTTKLPSPILSVPARLPGSSRFAVLAFDGTWLEVDGVTGKTVRRERADMGSSSAPLVTDHFIFAATRGTLWRISLP